MATSLTSAVAEVAEMGQRLAVAFEDVEDPPEHRRHDHRLGHRAVTARSHPPLWRERLQVDGAPAGERAGQHRRDPGDVVRRDADERRLVVGGAHELDRRDDVRREVTVAEHRRQPLIGPVV